MRVISVRRLKEFWGKHPKAEVPLTTWYQVARNATWRNTAEMLQTWPSADVVERLTVFNVGGNEFRLIARVEYQRHEIYIRGVFTRDEYDEEGWKHDPWFRRK